MQTSQHDLVNFIFNIANKLRGPYRPPQYRHVMLPMTVLRRLDCVLEATKPQVLKEYERLKDQNLPERMLHTKLGEIASPGRKQPLYNTSPFINFQALLGDPDGIAGNLLSYIRSFSPKAQEIFEKFKFDEQIRKLDDSNRLYLIVKEFADPSINLHPDHVSNVQMGYVFEELIRRFNEQANEEAGDHFTPREVIRLMAHLIYTGDEDVYRPGIIRTIYDPTCGTGGMLSVSEEYIREQNPDAHLELFGQDYNDESWAICCSDMLIKDEQVNNIVLGDVLGDGKTVDGHPGRQFHYIMANPPFGVEWKPEENTVRKEHDDHGFSGRFGPGLPRINDGSLLFLLHMISKMLPAPDDGGEGSKIAIVFNGSPLFTGDAGSGESNIRRWIIENDWLDAVVALPDQLFYNTGIYTYIWLVTNRKSEERRGRVQLIDATRHYEKMKKSLGQKRNELSEAHITEITRLYAEARDAGASVVTVDGTVEERTCSRLFDNREFGFLKLTVDRPLRLNFSASPERIERIEQESAFSKLAESRKKKDSKGYSEEIREGKIMQERIRELLESLDPTTLWRDREEFTAVLDHAAKSAGVKLNAPLKKAILSALSERDPDAAICRDSKGNPEPDTELRDTELVPLPADIPLPLPIDYDSKADNSRLVALVHDHCEEYIRREVLPHWPEAWVDYAKTKVGYEIPINRHFYQYQPPRPLEEIESEIRTLEQEIMAMLAEVTA